MWSCVIFWSYQVIMVQYLFSHKTFILRHPIASPHKNIYILFFISFFFPLKNNYILLFEMFKKPNNFTKKKTSFNEKCHIPTIDKICFALFFGIHTLTRRRNKPKCQIKYPTPQHLITISFLLINMGIRSTLEAD